MRPTATHRLEYLLTGRSCGRSPGPGRSGRPCATSPGRAEGRACPCGSANRFDKRATARSAGGSRCPWRFRSRVSISSTTAPVGATTAVPHGANMSPPGSDGEYGHSGWPTTSPGRQTPVGAWSSSHIRRLAARQRRSRWPKPAGRYDPGGAAPALELDDAASTWRQPMRALRSWVTTLPSAWPLVARIT